MVKEPPRHVSDLDIPAFRAFLERSGCDMLLESSEWEVLRVRAERGVCVLHKNKNGVLSWSPLLTEAYQFWKRGKMWAGRPRGSRRKGLRDKIQLLMDRDGPVCCYCATPLTVDTATVEHFLALGSGGHNRVANLGIACFACNVEVGDMPVAQKMKFRDMKRKEISDGQSC